MSRFKNKENDYSDLCNLLDSVVKKTVKPPFLVFHCFGAA